MIALHNYKLITVVSKQCKGNVPGNGTYYFTNLDFVTLQYDLIKDLNLHLEML